MIKYKSPKFTIVFMIYFIASGASYGENFTTKNNKSTKNDNRFAPVIWSDQASANTYTKNSPEKIYSWLTAQAKMQVPERNRIVEELKSKLPKNDHYTTHQEKIIIDKLREDIKNNMKYQDIPIIVGMSVPCRVIKYNQDNNEFFVSIGPPDYTTDRIQNTEPESSEPTRTNLHAYGLLSNSYTIQLKPQYKFVFGRNKNLNPSTYGRRRDSRLLFIAEFKIKSDRPPREVGEQLACLTAFSPIGPLVAQSHGYNPRKEHAQLNEKYIFGKIHKLVIYNRVTEEVYHVLLEERG